MQLNDRSGHGEGQLGERQRAVGQLEPAAQVRDDPLVFSALVALLPRPRRLNVADLALHVQVGESCLRQLEPAIQLKPLDDILRSRRQQHVRCQIDPPDERRLRSFNRQLHQIFEPCVVEAHVELDMPALDVLRANDGPLGGNRGLIQFRLNALEDRVAVRAVDDRLEACVQDHFLPGEVEREVGHFGGPLDFEPLEYSAVSARGRQGAVKPLDDVHVSVLEQIVAADRRKSGFVGMPRAERAGRVDHAAWDRIDQIGVEADPSRSPKSLIVSFCTSQTRGNLSGRREWISTRTELASMRSIRIGEGRSACGR